MSMRVCVICTFAVLAAVEAVGDVIYLANGGVLEGKVERVAEGYRVTAPTGVSVFPPEEVARWEKRPTPQEEYAQRTAATPLDDFYAQFSLAEWCRSRNMPEEARYHFLLAIALNPDHAEARRGAGYVREDGIWITVEESRRRHGLVEVNGKWLPAEEALRQEIAAQRQQRTQEAAAEAARIFQQAAKDKEADLAPWAEQMAAFGPCLLPTIERFSAQREARVRALAFLVLGRFACRASLDLLLKRFATEQENEVLRVLLAAFAARPDRRETLSRLLDMAVNRQIRRLRQRACLALRALADKRAIDALVPLAGYCPVPATADAARQTSGQIILTNATKADVDGQPVSGSGPRPQKPYYPAHEALIYLTGQMLPPDAKRWEDWWHVKRPNFVFKPLPGVDNRTSDGDSSDHIAIQIAGTKDEQQAASAEDKPLPQPAASAPPPAQEERVTPLVEDAAPPRL